jgi:hypothetical protein
MRPVERSRITIRFGAFKPLLIVLGLTPGRSYLDVSADTVRVRMSWGFRADIPRSSIRSVSPTGDRISIGVHGWRGRWLVNGAGGPLVTLRIEPPARAYMAGLPVELRELTVSVDDPAGVAAALQPV